jgi:Protein of unknown function (DUF2878)
MSRINPSGWTWTVLNIIGFQAVWLVSVIGAGRGFWWPGLAVAVVFASLTLAYSPQRHRDLRTLGIALPIGFVMDSILVQSQCLQFASPYPVPGLAPLWIMALWLGFALTLNHSLSSIYRKAVPTFLFGLLGGPLAYGIATLRFEAMAVQGSTVQCALWIGLVWGFGLSAIRWIDSRNFGLQKGQSA